MIRITESAQAHFRKLLAEQPDNTNIRVFVVNPARLQQNVAYLIAHQTR